MIFLGAVLSETKAWVVRAASRRADKSSAAASTMAPRARDVVLVSALLSFILLFINHVNSGSSVRRLNMEPVVAPAVPAAAAPHPVEKATSIIPPDVNDDLPIQYPTINSICETAAFAKDAKRLKVTIVVFAWRRLASLQRLVESLQQAEYCKHELPLNLFIDGGADKSVRSYVEGITWPHGPKTLHSYDDGAPLGIRGMWINATRKYALSPLCRHTPSPHTSPAHANIPLSAFPGTLATTSTYCRWRTTYRSHPFFIGGCYERSARTATSTTAI